MNVLSCGPKASNISGISEAISPRYIRKSSQNVRACAADDGAICYKNRKTVPGAGENTLRRLALFVYLNHPTKNDVASGKKER